MCVKKKRKLTDSLKNIIVARRENVYIQVIWKISNFTLRRKKKCIYTYIETNLQEKLIIHFAFFLYEDDDFFVPE